MKTETLINILIICILYIGIFLFFLIVSLTTNYPQECDLSCQKCCNAVPCTDTYYSQEDGMCHLVLCENSKLPFQSKTKCVYEPYR